MTARHPVVRGHPIHAMLSDLPAALVPTAFGFSALHALWRTDATRFAAASTTGLAFAGTLAAGAAGWWDWTTMPREHPAWRPGTLHGVLNTAGALAVAGAVVRPRKRTRLLAAATACMLAGAALGGELVFRLGWRVRPAEELEIAEERLRAAGDGSAIDAARREVAEFELRQTFWPAD